MKMAIKNCCGIKIKLLNAAHFRSATIHWISPLGFLWIHYDFSIYALFVQLVFKSIPFWLIHSWLRHRMICVLNEPSVYTHTQQSRQSCPIVYVCSILNFINIIWCLLRFSYLWWCVRCFRLDTFASVPTAFMHKASIKIRINFLAAQFLLLFVASFRFILLQFVFCSHRIYRNGQIKAVTFASIMFTMLFWIFLFRTPLE